MKHAADTRKNTQGRWQFSKEVKMSFISTIIVVEDVIKSRTLYENILNCKVTGDLVFITSDLRAVSLCIKRPLSRSCWQY